MVQLATFEDEHGVITRQVDGVTIEPEPGRIERRSLLDQFLGLLSSVRPKLCDDCKTVHVSSYLRHDQD
jgi:hypothetical protein